LRHTSARRYPINSADSLTIGSQPPAGQALTEACAQVGLDADGAQVIYSRANTVYRLADTPVVVRLRYAPGSAHRLARLTVSVQVTAWLSAMGFPAVRPLNVSQPVTAQGYIATFWHFVHPDEQPSDDIAVLARIIRELHSLPSPPAIRLPAVNPLGSLREDIRSCAWLAGAQRAWLEAHCDELERQYGEASWTLGSGLLHGDAYTDNLIYTRNAAVLADWDSVSYGPREQDVVPTRLRYRFGEPPSRWNRFCEVYGVDPDSMPGLPVLLQMREVRTVTPYLRSDSPRARAEVSRRIADLASGTQTRPWTALNLASDDPG
jgi:aminoglycoside phosphotransferase (APT) family kinase protein